MCLDQGTKSKINLSRRTTQSHHGPGLHGSKLPHRFPIWFIVQTWILRQIQLMLLLARKAIFIYVQSLPSSSSSVNPAISYYLDFLLDWLYWSSQLFIVVFLICLFSFCFKWHISSLTQKNKKNSILHYLSFSPKLPT